MSDKTVIGVDPVNGRSKLTYVDHAGPASYATGGEVWPQQSSLGGPNSVGLSDIAWCNGGYTEDGLYFVVPVFGGVGSLKGSIKLKWFVAGSGGTFTGTPATLTLPIGAGAATDAVGTSGASGTVTLGNGTGACTVNLNAFTPAGTIAGAVGGLTEVTAAVNLSASYLRLAVLGG
jgi:hypothetical protein